MMDERQFIEFETPYVLADVLPERIDAPEDMRRCSQCGANSKALPASELTVVKHRHESQPAGHMRLYCDEHLAGAREWSSGLGGSGGRTGPTCPNCFVSVPIGTLTCDQCGTVVQR